MANDSLPKPNIPQVKPPTGPGLTSPPNKPPQSGTVTQVGKVQTSPTPVPQASPQGQPPQVKQPSPGMAKSSTPTSLTPPQTATKPPLPSAPSSPSTAAPSSSRPIPFSPPVPANSVGSQPHPQVSTPAPVMPPSAPAPQATSRIGRPGLPPALSQLETQQTTPTENQSQTPLPPPTPPQIKQPSSEIANTSVPSGLTPPPPIPSSTSVLSPPPPGASKPSQVLSTPGSAPPQPGSSLVPPPVVQRPPTSLGALSSMTANKIPLNAQSAPTSSGIPSAPQPAQGSHQVTYAQQKKGSWLRFLPLIIGGVVLLVALIFAGMQFLGGGSGRTSIQPAPTNSGTGQTTNSPSSGKQATIEYWGLWEQSEIMKQVFQDFERDNPGITVNYRQQSHVDYRNRLQTAIASGNGPDLFRYHASWVPMMKDELAGMPSAVMSAAEYQETFYPIASQQLRYNGQIVGIPLMHEGLALLYNKEVFRSADLSPPQSWSELQAVAQQLTVRQGKTIKRAGIAMGNASNVEHFSDIITLLLLQNGADLSKPNSRETSDALLFYTNFATKLNIWDNSLPMSSVAFARGDVAMVFVPSWRIFEIQTINPDLQFGVVPVPQIPNATKISLANYWAEGVNAQGKNKDVSWKLLKYLSSPEVMRKLHSTQAQTRSFGEIYSRVDMAEELATNEFILPFLQDAPFAQSWYLNSATHDTGINDQLIQYYRDAINAIVEGKQVDTVLGTLDQGTNQVLRQYGALQ